MERSRTDPINAEAKEYLSGKTYSMETVSEIHNTIQTPVNSLADDITTDYKSAKTEPTSNQVDIVIKKMKEESKVDEPQVTKLTEGIQAEKSDILYNAPIYKVETEPNTLERDKRENIFEMSKQPTHEIPANKYLDQEKFELQKVEPENSCQRNNGKTVENINANNVVDTKATVIQRENHGKQAEDEVTSKISDGDSVRSDEGILAINTDIQKQNKTKYTENKDESNTIQTQVKNDKKPDSNFESQQQIAETKTHELERRESRISEKSATAVQAYQEALERILKAAKDKKKDKGDNEDDSSDIGLDLWKRAKASVLKNMKTPKQADTIQEGQEEGRVHAVRFHRWKRTAVPPARQSGYSNRRRSITEMQNTLRKKLALRRFRRIGNLVIFCRRCVQDHCFK